MSNNELFEKVKSLKLPAGKYALFGSTPLGIRGLKDLSHDADIIVTEDLWDELTRNQDWVLKTMTHGSKSSYLENDASDIQIWRDWYPGDWDVGKLIRESEIIDGLPFVRLNVVLKWKKLNAREKDLKDIETVEKFLRTQR